MSTNSQSRFRASGVVGGSLLALAAAWPLLGALTPVAPFLGSGTARSLGTALIETALLLQLAVRLDPPAGLRAWITSAAGFYLVGTAAARLVHPAASILAALAAAALFLGFAGLLPDLQRDRRLAAAAALFGLLLAAALAGLSADLSLFYETLGPEDGVRLRMLRLARVASLALPLFLLLYPSCTGSSRLRRFGAAALRLGAATMAPTLAAGALVHPALKYLLGIPADATLLGAAVAAWLTRQQPGCARWGWGLIFLSMIVGLLLGGFAFNGPLPPPPLLAAYGDWARQAVRAGHVAAILAGIVLLTRNEAPVEG